MKRSVHKRSSNRRRQQRITGAKPKRQSATFAPAPASFGIGAKVRGTCHDVSHSNESNLSQTPGVKKKIRSQGLTLQQFGLNPTGCRDGCLSKVPTQNCCRKVQNYPLARRNCSSGSFLVGHAVSTQFGVSCARRQLQFSMLSKVDYHLGPLSTDCDGCHSPVVNPQGPGLHLRTTYSLRVSSFLSLFSSKQRVKNLPSRKSHLSNLHRLIIRLRDCACQG
jgi:hypothetical protein